MYTVAVIHPRSVDASVMFEYTSSLKQQYVSRGATEHSHALPSFRHFIPIPIWPTQNLLPNYFDTMVAAPKRPARRKSNVQYNEQESSELSDDGLGFDSSPPPRKRARGRVGVSGSKAKKKGKAKQTSELLEMPLDVMFEVSGFLRAETVRYGGSGGSRCIDPRLRRTKRFVATVSDVQGP